MDGDGRRRHLRDRADRRVGLDRARRRGRVPARRRPRTGRRCARRPVPAQGAAADHDPIQTVLATLLTFLAATGAPEPGGRDAHRVRERLRAGDRVPRVPVGAARPRARARTSSARSRCRARSGTSAGSSGPALAGLVISVGGYAWAFGINTVSFLAVIVAVMLLRLPPPQSRRQLDPARRSGRASAYVAAGPGAPRRHRVHVRQHVPRRAVHRARAVHGRRTSSTRARSGPSVLVDRAGSRRGDDGADASATSRPASGAAGCSLAVLWALPPALAVYAVDADARAVPRSRSSSSASSTSARCRASRQHRPAPGADRDPRPGREPARGHPRHALPPRRDPPGRRSPTRSGSGRRPLVAAGLMLARARR